MLNKLRTFNAAQILERTLGSMEAHLLCFGSLEAFIVILTGGEPRGLIYQSRREIQLFCEIGHIIFSTNLRRPSLTIVLPGYHGPAQAAGDLR
ncbi:MAG: hypothetical protein ACRCYB_12130 [Aeromonas veronii]